MFRNKAVFLTCVFLLVFGLAGPVNARGGGFPRPESEGQTVKVDDELMSLLMKAEIMPKSGDQDVKSMLKDINNSSRSTPFSFSFAGRPFCFLKFNIMAEEPVACTVLMIKHCRSLRRRGPEIFYLTEQIVEREADTEHEIVFEVKSEDATHFHYVSDYISYDVSITQPEAEGDEGVESSSIPFTVSVELLEPDFVKEGKVDPEDPRASLPSEFRDAYREFVEEVERKYRLGGGMK